MFHQLRTIIGNLRSLATYALVQNVDDTGGAQMLMVKTGDGIGRAEVEAMQPFGFSSVSPPDGATTVVIEIGGDPGNMVAFAAVNPSARFGGLLTGEVVMYAGDGSRIHIRQGGEIEVWAGNSVTVNTRTATINAAEGITVNGNTLINGDLTATGNVSDGHGSLDRLRGHYNEHVHGSSPPPTPQDPE